MNTTTYYPSRGRSRTASKRTRPDRCTIKHLTDLTPREREVMTLLRLGKQYKEIASALCIGTETVRVHLRNIYEKLDVGNKVEAINRLYNAA